MARREIPMNEVVETIYQWHKGMKIQHISTLPGVGQKDRKEVCPHRGNAGNHSRRSTTRRAGLVGKLKGLLERPGVLLRDAGPRSHCPS